MRIKLLKKIAGEDVIPKIRKSNSKNPKIHSVFSKQSSFCESEQCKGVWEYLHPFSEVRVEIQTLQANDTLDAQL